MDEETLEEQLGLAGSVRLMLGVSSPSVSLDDEVVLSTDLRWRQRWAVGHVAVSALLRGEADVAAQIMRGIGTVSAVAIAVRMLHQGTLMLAASGSPAGLTQRGSRFLSILGSDAAADPGPFADGIQIGSRLTEEFWLGIDDDGRGPLLAAVCDRCALMSGLSRRAATAVIVQRYADTMPAALRRDPEALADEQAALATAVMAFNVVQWSGGHVHGS